MKSLLVANWKMNPETFKEAKKLFEATKKAADRAKSDEIVVAPPSIYIRELRSLYRGKRIAFAAQNARFEKNGAFTGDVSLMQVKDVGASYVIVGHAERRAAGESNEDTQKKVAASISLKMTPILCIGERQRAQDGEHFVFIKDQLRAGFADVAPAKLAFVVVAYEPVWAIGGESAMSPRDMHEMAIFIRKTIVELYGDKGMKVKILYGGSIDESNASAMLTEGDVDGLLVGRASAEPARFSALIATVAKAA